MAERIVSAARRGNYHIRQHHIHLLEAKCRRIAKAIVDKTPDIPPIPPSFLALLAMTRHEPTDEVY